MSVTPLFRRAARNAMSVPHEREVAAYQDAVADVTVPGEADRALGIRAKRVLPSLTHLDVSTHTTPGYPQFFKSGDGCRVRSIDGRTFIDYMCSYGPVLLGHKNRAVDDAVRSQLDLGDCLTGPTERMVECAEMLTAITPWSDWCYFAKNGTDATSIAVRVARSATGKRVVLRAPQAYHGSAPVWIEGDPATLHKQGVLAEDVRFIAPYTFNNLESVRAAMDRAGDDLAGIIVSAFQWDYAIPHSIATAEFLRGVRRLCDERGAVLICDDVRSSFRIHPAGTWADPRYGYGIDPDLTCLCKGIANGHPLSAVLGRAGRLRGAARRIRATGSFWANAVPFAAALATVPQAAAAAASAERMGERLRTGLLRQAADCGLADDFCWSGPPQMPYIYFKSELERPFPQRYKILIFCSVCASGGVWWHPHHTNFLGGAHTIADIDETLAVTARAFQRVANFVRRTAASHDAKL